MPREEPPQTPVVGRAGRLATTVAESVGAPPGGGDATAREARASAPLAIAALVAANLVPLAGVLLLGWSTFDLMLLYWVENGIVGLYALLKVLLARGGERGVAGALGRLGIGGLFALHFGAFWSVHGLLVVTLFGDDRGNAFVSLWEGPFGFFFGGWVIAGATLQGALLGSALGLLASHGVSFVANVLVRGEDLDLEPRALMTKPYGRVVVLHLTLLFGAVLVLGLREPVVGLTLFVLLKTTVDLSAHLRSHR